jgi:predicted  nucleic acid-binding Zn-ribbon protein
MTKGDPIKLTCANCGVEFLSEWASEKIKPPCPKCGSLKKMAYLSFIDHAQTPRDFLTGKVKNIKRPSNKKVRLEFLTGDNFCQSEGKWMLKERVLDKDNKIYKEVVIDPQTGQVIHHNEGSLLDHVGFGSAKFKLNKIISQ